MVEPVKIKLNGKEQGFHFNNFALAELGKALKVDPIDAHGKLMEIAQDDAVAAITFVLFAGFVGYEKAQGNFFHSITLASVAAEMATCNQEDFTEAYESFKQATGISEFLANLPQEEATEEQKKN